mmetsp:Transcript_13707/g.37905  ORF Transcript_13707/g.37905 Transcript_13707/m.37905 type:complete len:801 (-) Transcript_13707:200-2602(-)|eukprot:CAMPEP_0168736904 /NCGR_PEP_ID=MMETSP0724-20121128/10105_1 /TAXON_ID=265536 /ORGANISM="Amphiprora sp., Strain CCMP467" /LENGTH=800 /DNA_ID=CAMNT_0008784125 /DNA_START=157 /DNA_END=2559 /DNA_ORIENTATION=-
MAPVKRTSDFGRSAVDYVSKSELKEALATVIPQGKSNQDWMLPVPNDPTCEKQTEEGELQRLLNLKSFMLLDAEKDEKFDKLTQEAKEVFGVPTSLISLIDLGRQLFLSKAGSDAATETDATETTRADSFCGYTIQKKEGMLVVPDAKEDDRFKDGELVNSGPKIRFYAGAALVSPEGEKLGAFCLNGTEPRPEGLNEEEKKKLKEYAAKTMEIMVERRKRLRDRLSAESVSTEILRHSAVATSLGDILYMEGDLYTAMRLYQESIQTIMSVDRSTAEKKTNGKVSPTPTFTPVPQERRQTMLELLQQISQKDKTLPKSELKTKKELLEQVVALFPTKDENVPDNGVVDGVSGLFHLRPTMRNASTRVLPGLVFSDVFKIDMQDCLDRHEKEMKATPLQQLDFTVPMDECSKATLFNMGQIQYHWQNQEAAMQFFHLAASVSHKMSPLAFDPVDISCINNMAQIHLQCGQPEDSLKMLREALDRGSKTLAAIYRLSEIERNDTDEEKDTAEDEQKKPQAKQGKRPAADASASVVSWELMDAYRTHRLRRKLARTLVNIAHVLFHQNHLEEAMASLRDAVPLIDQRTMTGRTLAAIHYNMSVILHRQGDHAQALTYLDKFLVAAEKLNGHDHLQTGDALHEKAIILYEMGKFHDAMGPIKEAIRLRKKHVGEVASCVAESVELQGKLLLSQQKYDEALQCMSKTLGCCGGNGEMTLEAAQTLLDMGRAYHTKGDKSSALATYGQVWDWAKKFFGPNHAFVARIGGIISGIQQSERGSPTNGRPAKRLKQEGGKSKRMSAAF